MRGQDLGSHSLHDLTFSKAVRRCEKELFTHVKGIFWADVIALGAKDALSYIYPYTLRLRQELNCMGWTDLNAEGAADTGLTVVYDLPTEIRGDRDWRVDCHFTFYHPG